MDYIILSFILGIIFTLIGYYYYIKDVFLGKTKPHIITWSIWGLLTLVAFFVQLSDNAGLGAWITGITAIISFIIAFISIKKGNMDITKTDKYSFIGAILAIIIWYITNNALYSILLIIFIDILAFYPTFRKSYYKPFEETLSTYIFSSFKFLFSILALSNFTLITYIYPLSLVIMNGIFVIMLFYRRKKIINSNIELTLI